MDVPSDRDFRDLFESVPDLYLVLKPDLTIAAVSDAYLRATMTRREDILGRALFDAFPDDPDDPAATGGGDLRASLERVRDGKSADAMAVRKHGVPRPESEGGGLEERFWSPRNYPVLGPDGELLWIIHRLEDVTELARLKRLHERVDDPLDARAAEDAPAADVELARDLLVGELKPSDEKPVLPPEDGRPLVLVVDEDAGMRRCVSDSLSADFRVIAARDGLEALRLALHHAPDLIVADVAMPRLPGEELVRRVRERASLADIPVILLTAKADDESRVRLLRAGARDFVTKPFSRAELRARARSFVQLKLAQDDLRLKNAALAAATEELESFNYSVSHDLRAPLRTIDGFSQVLMEDAAPNLSEEQLDSLHRVRGAAQHMSRLIDALLELSRVMRAPLARVPVDLSAVASEIFAELRRTSPGRDVEAAVAPGVTAEGDPRLLKIALRNLFENAWKYTGKHARARVEFGVEEKDGRAVYFVRDDGAGFDQNYAAKLFNPFQRLHAASDFPGVGVGLATVQRIVRRHGGRIRAEGRIEGGATFRFTLWEHVHE